MGDVMDTDSRHADVVALLLGQHEQVRTLLDAVSQAAPAGKQQAFDELREFLARHETAEEMVLRPITRGVAGGEPVAEQRMDEENQSKDELADLEKMDASSAEFDTAFATFRQAVLRHAQAEETEEFPLLRTEADEDTLRKAEQQLRLAEKTAPTHPHPTARTTTANYVAGPFAAMVDRARDALKNVTSG